jgi:hypothetical protein
VTLWRIVRLWIPVLSSALVVMPLTAATPAGPGATPAAAAPATTPANSTTPSGNAPRSAAAPTSAGRVEILRGSDPACNSLRDELAGHWQSHGFDAEPPWKDPERVFPRDLGDAEETDLDFYNDGKLARVFIAYYDSGDMKRSALLVQPGRSAQRLDVASVDPLEDPDTWFIPCQLQGKRFPLNECPPFSGSHLDAGLTVPGRERTQVHFPGRYTELALVRLHDTTFLVVTASAPESAAYAAVLKPLATRTFRTTCLLQRH